MENTTLYELYYCDEWRSTDSINIRSRVVITDDLEFMSEVIYDCVKRDPCAKEEYKDLDRFDMLEAVQNQWIDFLHLETVELNERQDQ